MSFDINYTLRISAGASERAPVDYSYVSSSDSLATISASGYFNDWMEDLTNGVGTLKVGDRIQVQGSDENAILRVTAVTTAVTTTPHVIMTGNSTNYIGNSTKTSYTRIAGYTKFDARPSGGATYDYCNQMRMESGKTSGSVWGYDGELHMTADGTASMRCLQGVAVLDSGYTATGATYVGVYAQARSDGTFAGAGFLIASYSLIEDGAAITASHVASQWLDSHQAQTVTGSHELAYWTHNGSTTMDQALYLYGGNNITALFNLNTCSGMVSDTAETGGTSKKIKVVLEGVTHYINAYTG